jgi:hypothetical protein
MRHCLLFAVSLVGLLMATENWASEDASDGALLTPPRTVATIIDYGDGVEVHFKALPWNAKMTVLDALTAVGNHPHGVKAVIRGAGANAFVTQLGDLKNEGGGKQSHNWLFSVNNVEGEVGAGAAELKPADVVLWRYGVADNNDQDSK